MAPASAQEMQAPELQRFVSRAAFGRQVDLHVLAVQRMSRLWWHRHAPPLFAGATDRQLERLLDLLSELARTHDVSKRGTVYRNDSRFRAEFDFLEKAFDDYYGRSGRDRRHVERGADLLHDLVGVRIFDPGTDPGIASLGRRTVRLLNTIDEIAMRNLVDAPAYASLPERWRWALVGGISLCDLTHRHLASSPRPFERGGLSVTQLEFGKSLAPAAEFLHARDAQRDGIPGVPAEHRDAYPMSRAIADARAMESDWNVLRIAQLTSMSAEPGAFDPCAWSLVYGE